MKILFCLGGLNKGGAERVASNLCNYFVDNENDVEILATRIDNISYRINPKIVVKSLQSGSKKENIIIKNINLIKKMKNEILNYNPDIIISFLKQPTFRILFLKKFDKNIKKVPIIISIRNDPKMIYKSFIDKLSIKILYNSADGYIFQTDEAKEFFNKKIKDKSVIIPNPVNDKFITEPYKGKRKKTIVTVGRLTKQKNQKLLIDSFKEVLANYNDHELYIYGEGELKEELENYITKNDLKDKVMLKGLSDNLEKEIYDAGLFVLSSDYEGMPNALMEAMCMGLPCISTDCSGGGARFLIEDGVNGLLVPVNDSEKMKDAMSMLIDNPNIAEKLGKNAHKSLKKLTQNNINDFWLKYIIQLLEGKK